MSTKKKPIFKKCIHNILEEVCHQLDEVSLETSNIIEEFKKIQDKKSNDKHENSDSKIENIKNS